LEVIEPVKGQLWFAGHQMLPDKQLKDYVGGNEKTKVLVKLVKCGEGPPGREQAITEEMRKQMMLQAYRRQEEIKVSDA
jgi:cilia- and flagella-associated protein 298